MRRAVSASGQTTIVACGGWLLTPVSRGFCQSFSGVSVSAAMEASAPDAARNKTLRSNDAQSLAVKMVFINGTTFTKRPSRCKPIAGAQSLPTRLNGLTNGWQRAWPQERWLQPAEAAE